MGIHESLSAIVTHRRDAESNQSGPETPSRMGSAHGIQKRKTYVRNLTCVRNATMSASFWSSGTRRQSLAWPEPPRQNSRCSSCWALPCSRCAPSARPILKFGLWVGQPLRPRDWPSTASRRKFLPPFDQVAVQATFVLAAGLLAGAVLVYTGTRDLILPLMVITPILVGFTGARSCCGRIPCRCAWPWKSATASFCSPLDCSAARSPRTEGALGMVAGSVAAISSSRLVAFY